MKHQLKIPRLNRHLALGVTLPMLLASMAQASDRSIAAVENISTAEAARTSLLTDTKIAGTAQFRGQKIDETYNQSQAVGTTLGLDITHQLDTNLSANLSFGMNLDSGASQNTFSSEHKPRQGVTLFNADLTWKPVTDWELKGGALDQSWLKAPQLLSDVAFPSAFLNYSKSLDSFYITVAGEAAIPTADTTNSMPQGPDKLPTADFEQIALGNAFSKTSKVEAHLGHFAFSDLPSGIALESRYRGNKVDGAGENGSSFVYAYSGIELGLGGQTTLTERFDAAFESNWMTNLRAPTERSRAMRLKGQTTYHMTPTLELTPSLEIFRAEADASPAYYTAANLAHNNRQGYSTGLKLGLSRQKLELEGDFTQARCIQSDPFQHDFTGVFFSLRKSYDLL